MVARGSRIAVIGAGSVGAAVCYALLLRPICSELILVDVDQQRCIGEVADLQDGTFLSNTRVRVGTPQEAGQCDLVVITAGAKQRPNETRLQLVDRNLAILRSILDSMKPMREETVLLLVANPVDILTYFAQKWSGLPATQVLGTGTFLDTARLRHAIASRAQVFIVFLFLKVYTFNVSINYQVAFTAVHVYVLGEHGDSQFPCWSSAHIGGVPLLEYPGFNRQMLDELAEKTKKKAYDIIAAKGIQMHVTQ